MENAQSDSSYRVRDRRFSVRAATARAREELLVGAALTIWADGR